LKNGGWKREGRAQKEKRGPAVSANSSSLSRARARVSPETCWSLRLATTTFSSSGDSWSEVREGGTPSEASICPERVEFLGIFILTLRLLSD
jgi:hypothetical protein